ncbi:unnamed protein product [Rotaria socialis]|uniref:Uncharacterized protein n=1 Tax=Rotaria socialis TaxID=392032 RepID=A0A817QBA9_9BILA|nr:unnamed protein product [Rotaria socialis]
MLRIKQQTNPSVTSKESVPLKEVYIEACLHSFAADVKLTQVFRNDESVPIEAVYCFPVEENAAIYAFVARIDDGREIVAEIKEKKLAQQEYTHALAQGHGAYLFEQDEDSNDIFVVSVGALKPNTECRITISYVTELDLLHDNEKPIIRFVIPTTIAPRYSPSNKGISSPGGTQAEYIESAPYTIEFVCKIDKIDQHVSSISSPSHPIVVDFNNDDAFIVTFSQQGIQLDRDIIVDIELSKTRTNTIAAVEKGALMVSFMPNEEDCRGSSNDRRNEFLFIIDCSGSMDEDNKIGLACKAMLLFLKSLPTNCCFNIVRFGSTFSPLFSDQVTREYNATNLHEAETLIKCMTANMGGTELLEPLKWLKKNKPPVGCARQIFLLTDGEVSNVDQVTNLCRDMAAFTRIFSFGLGHSPSRALVKGLARVTNGYYTFIPPQTKVDIHVAKQLARALQPSISNVHVKWNTNQTVLHSIPNHAPPVFARDRLLFYALLDESMAFDHATTVELFADISQKPLGVARIDHIPSVVDSQTIRRLAAKSLLHELLHGEKPAARECIIGLSLKYGILCPYTAFIGLERRLDVDSASNADMELREVPIVLSPMNSSLRRLFPVSSSISSNRISSLQTDIDDIVDTMRFNEIALLSRGDELSELSCKADMLESGSHAFYLSAAKLKRRKGFGSILQPAIGYVSSLFTKKTGVQPNNSRSNSHMHSTLSASPSGSMMNSPIMSASMDIFQAIDIQSQQKSEVDWPTDEYELVSRFVELQQYDGLWMLTEYDIKQLTGKSLANFSSSMVDTMEKASRNSVTTTAFVLVFLETRCISKKTLWQALSTKAHKRIAELLGGDETKVEQLLKDVRDQLM